MNSFEKSTMRRIQSWLERRGFAIVDADKQSEIISKLDNCNKQLRDASLVFFDNIENDLTAEELRNRRANLYRAITSCQNLMTVISVNLNNETWKEQE